MRVFLLGLFLAVMLAATGSATPSTVAFAYGVAAGEITPTSALLWTRAGRSGNVTVEVKSGRTVAARGAARAAASGDFTVTVPLKGLRPNAGYTYRFRQGSSTSPEGHFRTAPAPTSAASVRFAVSGDADATPGADGKPGFNRFQVYARMAAEQNDFNINLGDTIYSDSEIGGAKPALTVSEKWAKYRLGLALPALRTFRAATGSYSHWDDHEFINDFSKAENGSAIYAAGVKAFTDYAPVRTGADGLYRTFRWGRNVELFFLDERSFRSAKASAGGTCTVAGAVDLAPTAPAPVRAAFALLAPTLALPVPQACIDKINDPATTLLGSRQLNRFLADVRRSTATFKVIVNETPMMQLFALPYDRWEGYAAERTKVVEALRGIENVVVLTTDTHSNLVGDVRLQTFAAGGPVASGITEIVTGPVATNTYAKEIDNVLGKPGTGLLIGAIFFKPPPPSGLGLTCAALDTYSYAQVVATNSKLTVTLKDLNGKPVKDAVGDACAPVVIAAK